MKTKRVFRYFLFLMIFSLLLTGCDVFGQNVATPTVDLAATQAQNALRTEAAITVEVAMTEAAAVTATAAVPSPSDTPEEPTVTATLTETLLLLQTSTATTTPTPFVTSTLVLPSVTTAPVQYQCNLIRTTPRYKAVLEKGEDFDVHWILLNSGTEPWYYETVTGGFRNGIELHRYDDFFNLTGVVYPGDTYEVIVDMQAPREAGEYSAVWILKTKKETFCWYSVDIVVAD